MKWFNGLEQGSIGPFEELTRAFGAQFVACSKVPRHLDSLLSMVMRKGETLKTYSDRYWETFNEIDGGFKDVVIRTFKVGLPTNHDLRKSLTMKPARSIRQLMDQINVYNPIKENQLQGKGKAEIPLLPPPLKEEIPGLIGTSIINLEETSSTSPHMLTLK